MAKTKKRPPLKTTCPGPSRGENHQLLAKKPENAPIIPGIPAFYAPFP
jgi:hypothetical protein